jgi:hypothetical protein
MSLPVTSQPAVQTAFATSLSSVVSLPPWRVTVPAMRGSILQDDPVCVKGKRLQMTGSAKRIRRIPKISRTIGMGRIVCCFSG